jgi:hypothetical protein
VSTDTTATSGYPMSSLTGINKIDERSSFVVASERERERDETHFSHFPLYHFRMNIFPFILSTKL